MTTRARTLSINVRNKTAVADIAFPSRHWSRRLPVLIRFIRNVAPSVVGVQECRDDMAVDITNGLGPAWTFWGMRTAKIIWDTSKWTAIDQFEAGLPFKELGITKYRPLTMVKLMSIRTGESAWFASIHLVTNIANEEFIRQAQMRLIIEYISERPDNSRVIIFADLNSVPTTSSVRKIARDAGYNHLRARLSDAAMTGDSRNTFNGWKITKREGKWIDDVLTSRSVRPYSGVVELTDTTAYLIFVTDHNGVFARVEFGVSGV